MTKIRTIYKMKMKGKKKREGSLDMNNPETVSRKSEDLNLSLEDVFRPKIVNSSAEVPQNKNLED